VIAEAQALAVLALGAGLTALNVVGRARGVALYPVSRRFPPGEEGLARTTLLGGPDDLRRHPGEAPAAYGSRLAHGINRHMIHSAGSEFPLISPFHNWVLWLLGLMLPSRFRHFEFRNARYALERGFGLCSQSAAALADLLHRGGARAAIVRLDGHVVVAVEAEPARWTVLDPDFGVAVPASLAEIQPDAAARVAQAYGASYGPDVVLRLTKAYAGPHDVQPYPSPRDSVWAACERAAFVVKWLFPMALIGLGVWWLWCAGSR
jgi:hypothetical protein